MVFAPVALALKFSTGAVAAQILYVASELFSPFFATTLISYSQAGFKSTKVNLLDCVIPFSVFAPFVTS